MHIWVSGFENLYSITKDGRVYSHKTGIGTYGEITQLKPQQTTKGYLQVTLYKEGKSYQRRIHRLIAETFIQRDNNRLIVDHIDGNKHNNSCDNLRWVTNQQNTSKALAKKFKLVHKDGRVVEGNNLRAFCRENGFDQAAIYKMMSGLRKSASGFIEGKIYG